ncbi:hypothetical protein HDV00_003474 [Rhizophlyctis rosea]|nr:hypothetical protein HDV00_003474 [Rhizophlyctis rosea]
MDQSFATLFRSSRIAGLQTKQIVKVPKSARIDGDAGLKHAVPLYKPQMKKNEEGLLYYTNSGRPLKQVQVKTLDDELTKGPKYDWTGKRVGMIQRWKENFPAPSEIPEARYWALAAFDHELPDTQSSSPLSRPTTITTTTTTTLTPTSSTSQTISSKSEILPQNAPKPYVEAMSQTQWLNLLQKARRRSPEFRSLVSQRRADPLSYAQHLDVSITERGHTSLPLRSVPTVPVHPPVYTVDRSLPLKEGQKVWGRILNQLSPGSRGGYQDAHGWAVGIAGIVAYMPRSNAPSDLRDMVRDTYELFTIKVARHDSQGRPEVVVSMRDESIMSGPASTTAETWANLFIDMGKQPAGVPGGKGKKEVESGFVSGESMVDQLGSLFGGRSRAGKEEEKAKREEEDRKGESFSSILKGFEAPRK